MTAETLVAKLDGVQGRGPRWRAICPAHASKNRTRSLAIFEADDGRVLVKCFAGCDVSAIVAAVGLQIDDLFQPRPVADGAPRPRRPWSARDVAHALEAEAAVAWVVLTDIAAGKPITKTDRERAGVAADRCAHLLRELATAG
jgi:hypothetical protein